MEVVSSLPGRLRLRSPLLRNDIFDQEKISGLLKSATGILEVRMNRYAGSVLINYDPSAVDLLELLRDLGVTALPQQTANGNAGLALYRRPSPWAKLTNKGSDPLSLLVKTLAKSVERATGGMSLPLFTTYVLLAFGISRLLTAEQNETPNWYNLLWFALGTYSIAEPNNT